MHTSPEVLDNNDTRQMLSTGNSTLSFWSVKFYHRYICFDNTSLASLAFTNEFEPQVESYGSIWHWNIAS